MSATITTDRITITAEPAKPPKSRLFEARGMLAIMPRAVAGEWLEVPERQHQATTEAGAVAVVTVEGPISQYGDCWCDGYDTIVARCEAALASSASAVVLRVNSPGGILYGAIDAAYALRIRADAARKPFICYVDGEAGSAAYALACAADAIYLATNAVVGSIGVVEARCDMSGRDAQSGIRVTLIASGARKLYGHPEVPLSDTELADTQLLVNTLAQPFFQLVAARRGLTVEAVAGYQAGIFTGPAAVGVRLADQSGMPFDTLIASLKQGTVIAMKYEDIIAALSAMGEGEDPNAANARRMLAAVAGGDAPEPDAEGDTEEPSAEGGAEDPEDPPADSPPAARSVSARTGADLAAQVASMSARLQRFEAQRDRTEIERLLKGQPKALCAVLRGKPLADVRAIVAALPKPGRVPPVTTLSNPESTPTAGPHKPKASRELTARIDRAMGYRAGGEPKRVAKLINGSLFFDVPEDYDPNTYGQA